MSRLKVVIVTEAWKPQINGVVTTLSRTGEELVKLGYDVSYITPEYFETFPLPTYKEIRVALFPYRKLSRIMLSARPDIVHIATEGPLGLAARRFCLSHGIKFTTSYHTQFPDYVRMRAPVPRRWTYAYLRWFHSAAESTMVPTPAVKHALQARGFENVVVWGRGVDTDLFRPDRRMHGKFDGPVFAYVGRVAVEKNIEAFLELSLPGTKLVVGDGPDLEKLKRTYPDAEFVGFKTGEELAAYLATADVFVFPSRTDTFGIVMLEAMACGVPVAAYRVQGPIDVVMNGVTGCLSDNLQEAALKALDLSKAPCREHALQRSWAVATSQLAKHLEVNAGRRLRWSRTTVPASTS